MFKRTYWYLTYWLKSHNQHGLHSPFLYELRTQWWVDKKFYDDFTVLDGLKVALLNDKRKIQITDFGAGSTVNKSQERSLSSLAKHSSKSNQLHHFLFRLFNELNPATIVELGTSLGITTSYIAKALPNSQVFTFEGCENTLNEASSNFNKLAIKNIFPVLGNIDDTLGPTVSKIRQVDAAFLDGNHTYQATLNYFNCIESKLSEKSFVIVDDIYWSKGMKRAWEQLKTHTKVTTSIDLFHMGILFFNPDLPTQQVTIR